MRKMYGRVPTVAAPTEGSLISLKPNRASKKQRRQRCKVRTKAGASCQAPAMERGLCFFHAHPEKLAEIGRQGGKKNGHWKQADCDLLQIRLKSIGDVSGLLEESINRVRRGPFDLRAANAIGFLAWHSYQGVRERKDRRPFGPFGSNYDRQDRDRNV